MKNMTLKNITAACHGTFHGDSSFLEKEITGVAIDSRKATSGFLFVPLKGARVDGHTFIPQIMKQGALATLTEEDPSSLTCPCIHVESCEKALSDIEAFYRMKLSESPEVSERPAQKRRSLLFFPRNTTFLRQRAILTTESDFRLLSLTLRKSTKLPSSRWESTILAKCMNSHLSASRISV